MEHGSEHVWVYSDCSDDEYVSDKELEEGMWLSLSEGSDSEGEETVKASKFPPAPASPLAQAQDLEGSRTKYLPPESDSDSDVEDNVEEPTLKADKDRKPKAGAVEYVELDLPQASGGGPVEKKSSSSNYVQIKPHVKFASAPSVATPPPPPPLPPKGIIKNRLNSQRVKRVKKQRVSLAPPTFSQRSNRGRVVRRTDTNIIAVKFNKLIEPSDVHTGDPVVCTNKNCSAVLSHLSSTVDQADKDEKLWVCEFCGERNEVDIVPEEIPTKTDTTFLISPPPTFEGVAGGGGAGVDEALVVFCIDISGSMCVTTEVPGKFELKGHERVKELSSLNVDKEDQYLPRQRRNVTYVSRLQSVQAAVDFQLSELAKTNPNQRVALVTFSDEVTLIGDGRGEVVTLAGDKLWSSDPIIKVGSEVAMPSAISLTKKSLSGKIFQLEESGQTALGPALLVSISLASRVPGSKVIICTDGLANKGVGNLDGLASAESRAAAQTFYEDMGTLALEKNVMVSLVRIKGTDCKALELGQVADKTGGEVTIVDPLNITKEFSSILANPIIATNVRTKIVLHGQLYFRTEESKESLLTIPVGNVTADSELTYEYGVRNTSRRSQAASKGATPTPTKDSKVPPLTLKGKPHLPFQLQIEYTGRDGSRCMRVITEAKPMTKDRSQAERDIRMGVIGTHAAHKTAQLAMDGEYTHARLNALSSQRLLQRSSHTSSENRSAYTTVMEDLIPLENALKTKQSSERHTMGRQYSDEETEELEFYEMKSELMASPLALPSASGASPVSRKSVPKKKKAISRRKDISDDLATYCYNMKKSNYETPKEE